MKRIISVILSVVFVLSFCSCGEKDSELYYVGMEIIESIVEKAGSEEWNKAYGASDDIRDYGEKIVKGDYSKPTAVYEIKLTDTDDFAKKAGIDLREFSEDLKAEMTNALLSTIPTRMSSAMGTSALAATTVYRAGKLFVNKDLKENVLYVYTFDEGYPVFINFVKGKDGAVSAQGTIAFSEEVMDTLDEMDENGIKITKIK